MTPDDARNGDPRSPVSRDPAPPPADPRIAPLLRTLDVLGAAARHLDPSILELLGQTVEAPAAALHQVVDHPNDAAGAALDAACRMALAACDDLRVACLHDDLRAAYRALRAVAAVEEQIYPLCPWDATVSRHFLPVALRDDAAARVRASVAAQPGRTGLLHVSSTRGTRGGFSMYVPEHYTPERRWPLVVALHGGGGHGRDFLWQWLKDARGRGAIVVAPTSSGRTWPLQEEDRDTPRLLELVDQVRSGWSIDPRRVLLTGMSDGGTFAYLAGLQTDAPFTHLAPVSSAFHPILVEVAEPDRLRGLPIFVAHGALDWMFPVEMARSAATLLSAAGAAVRYREVADLGHCHPVERVGEILHWLQGDPTVQSMRG